MLNCLGDPANSFEDLGVFARVSREATFLAVERIPLTLWEHERLLAGQWRSCRRRVAFLCSLLWHVLRNAIHGRDGKHGTSTTAFDQVSWKAADSRQTSGGQYRKISRHDSEHVPC